MISIDKDQLKSLGYTETGTKQFESAILDYGKLIHEKALGISGLEKSKEMSVEITHSHVAQGASHAFRYIGDKRLPWYSIIARIGEPIALLIAGYGIGNLDKPHGILCFGIGLFISLICITITIAFRKGE